MQPAATQSDSICDLPIDTMALCNTCQGEKLWYLPKAYNELVGPQQSKEVVDEGILHVLVPLEVIAAVGVIGALLYLRSRAALHCSSRE